ncbi:MAG TPA: DUF3574 domain-containing protein [Xanthomonadales bacterium]|nr:DUF3574 domain-containing protein [Xanthomonadales bacterium]
MNRIVRVPGLILTLALASCATHPIVGCASGAGESVMDLLYFGTATPDGVVSDVEWQAFLRDVVTPRFPDGLTTWTAAGQWRGADGEIVREGSHVLQLMHARDPAFERSIGTIAADYNARFRQEAVLRITTPVCMRMLTKDSIP